MYGRPRSDPQSKLFVLDGTTSADVQENIKPIINHIFDNYRTRLEALGQRPYLRAFIQGLTTRWEQNNEPPPAPPQLDAEASSNTGSGSGWKNQAQEEDYFNGSDEEDTPKRPNKRPKPPFPTATPTRGRANTGVQRSPTTRSKPSLVDYDDGSDSDGSNGTQSPRQPGGSVDATQELEEDLGDVAMRMRAKRQREEEDDEGFAGLLGIAKAAGGGSMSKEPVKAEESKPKVKPAAALPTAAKEEKKEVTTPGKRLKLHLGFGKKK